MKFRDWLIVALGVLLVLSFFVHCLEEDKLNRRIHDLELAHGYDTWK